MALDVLNQLSKTQDKLQVKQMLVFINQLTWHKKLKAIPHGPLLKMNAELLVNTLTEMHK